MSAGSVDDLAGLHAEITQTILKLSDRSSEVVAA
jgi:hypothetical protein